MRVYVKMFYGKRAGKSPDFSKIYAKIRIFVCFDGRFVTQSARSRVALSSHLPCFPKFKILKKYMANGMPGHFAPNSLCSFGGGTVFLHQVSSGLVRGMVASPTRTTPAQNSANHGTSTIKRIDVIDIDMKPHITS